MRGGSSKRVSGAAMLCVALTACSGTMPGIEDKPPAAKVEMTGRWLLTAANAPACGMTFGSSAEPQSGGIKPEGGCPGDFFTSRHWRLQQDDLLISNHNDEPLAQLHFVGGRFEGKSTGGLQVTLARSILPAN